MGFPTFPLHNGPPLRWRTVKTLLNEGHVTLRPKRKVWTETHPKSSERLRPYRILHLTDVRRYRGRKGTESDNGGTGGQPTDGHLS